MLKKYIEIKEQLESYKKTLDAVEDVKRDVNKLINITQQNCSHNIVLAYNEFSDIKICNCLICNKSLEVKESYNIIDITDKVNVDNLCLLENGQSVFLKRARKKFDDVIEFSKSTGISYKDSIIRDIILDDLIEYDKRLDKSKKLIKEK